MVRFIFLPHGEFGKAEAPEHPGRIIGLILMASKVGTAPWPSSAPPPPHPAKGALSWG